MIALLLALLPPFTATPEDYGVRRVAWSPDGGAVALCGETGVLLARPDGATVRVLASEPGCREVAFEDDGALLLAYETVSGDVVLGAVQLVDGVVTVARDDLRRSAEPCCGQDLIGRPVERVLPQLGPPRSIEQLGDSARYVFADREVTVHEGVVACVVPLSRVTASA